ncbi:MAG: LacI family DNA-binding transcriptional regulator [Anaerovoracaceae bacterium]
MSIKKVAKEAGVSITTVSRVLNNPETVAKETREKVHTVMEKMNYSPNWFARSIHTQKSFLLALLIPDFLNPSYMEIAKGVEDVASQKNYKVMICRTGYNADEEKRQIKSFIQRKADGILLASSSMSKKDFEGITNSHSEIVLINPPSFDTKFDSVFTDIREAAKIATTHLIKNGYRNVITVLPRDNVVNSKLKKLGYDDAKSDFANENSGIVMNKEYQNGDYKGMGIVAENSIEGGYIAGSKLLSLSERIDGVLCGSDKIAFGLIEKFKEEEIKVPEDIAVIGWGNQEESSIVEPSLTTIAEPNYKMGLMAARLLFDKMEGNAEQDPQEIILLSKIKIRKSCGHKVIVDEIL